ncbi:MAG: isoprenyl transferase [Flavobacteriales bacterium]|nr:isoprenyl transferase [Flavobacteriales bacterium]
MSFKEKIDISKLPKHVSIIMDGNGRWAKQKGQIRIFGHRNAIESVRDTVEAAAEIGVQFLTLYAFSTENWNRPKFEVNALMELLVTSLHKELPTLMKNGIKLQTIGNVASLPKKCGKTLSQTIKETSSNDKLTLILALSYSARWEILEAVKNIIHDAKNNKLTELEFNEPDFESYLNTKGIPDPELMIRTSGEQRISNFLLWQSAYTEFYFTETLWPDFRKEDFYKALYHYQNRERRFGKTSEQLQS